MVNSHQLHNSAEIWLRCYHPVRDFLEREWWFNSD